MLGSITDWVILIVVVVVLFGGASRIPELARAIGRATGEYKKAQTEVEKELRKVQDAPLTQNQSNAFNTPQASKAGTNENNNEALNTRIQELEKQLNELKEKQATATHSN